MTPSHIDVRDPSAMRALAHPLRLKLIAVLRRDGAKTVGDLSEQLDAAPGSISYHLATLSRFGFVEEAPELARDGRERWWRAAHAVTSYDPAEMLGSPETARDGRRMREAILQGHLAEQLEYLDAERALPAEWVTAATASDALTHLAPDELAELGRELNAVAEKWQRSREDAADGAVPVRIIFSAFRQP